MKILICALAVVLLFPASPIHGQTYTEGDTLFVVAQSGLRLRTSPNTEAGTIRILEYGDPVVVSNTYGFDEAYHEKSNWLDGQWIQVTAHRVTGYLFDAYLTALAPVSHEDELCSEPMRFSAPVQTYLAHHYPVKWDEHGGEHREDIDQCITYYAPHIALTVTSGQGWYKTDVEFDGYRLSEVVNLLRSMLIGNDMLKLFDDSLTFYTDSQGMTSRIRGGLDDYRISIEKRGDSLIVVSFTELIDG